MWLSWYSVCLACRITMLNSQKGIKFGLEVHGYIYSTQEIEPQESEVDI